MPRTIRLPAVLFTLIVAAVFAADPTPVVFTGHTDPVYAVAVSPDASIVATGSFDKSIKLWDAATGKEIRTLAGPKGHESLVLSVAFHPAGDQLASGGADNFARVWDVPSRTPTRTLPLGAPGGPVAVSADGKVFATGAATGLIRIWSAEGKPVDLTGHVGKVNGIAFTPDAKALVSVGADRTLRYWNATTGQASGIVGVGAFAADDVVVLPGNAGVLTVGADGVGRIWSLTPPEPKTFPPTPAGVTAVAALADASAVAGKSDVQWLNTGTRKPVFPIPAVPGQITAVGASPTGPAVGTSDGTLSAWAAGKPAKPVKLHTAAILAVQYTPNPPQWVTVGADGLAKAVTVADAKERTFPIPKDVTAAAFSNSQFATVTAAGAVQTWDTASGKEGRKLGTVPAGRAVVATDREGHRIVVAVGKTVSVWEIFEGRQIGRFEIPFDATAAAVTPDRVRVILGSAEGAWVCELPTGIVQQVIPTPSPVTAVAVVSDQAVLVGEKSGASAIYTIPVVKRVVEREAPGHARPIPNANLYLAYGTGPTVSLRRAGDGAAERNLDGVGPAKVAAVSKNGQVVAIAGGPEPGIHLHSASDGRRIGTIAQANAVIDLAFHPSGLSLAASLADNTVVTWNVVGTPGQPTPPEFGSVTQSFPHPTAVSSLAYLGTGEQLVTAAADGNVRVWRVAADTPIKSFQHPNLVDAVAYSPDGKTLATGCHDGNLRLFDVAKAALAKQVAAHTTPQPTPIYAVAWTPDGKLVLTAGFDQTIKMWDATAGTLVREIKAGTDTTPGHRDQVFAIAVTADGKKLASGSSDRTVKLWEVDTGKFVRDFPNAELPPGKVSHPGFVHSVRFSADGSKVISAGTAPKGKGYLAVWSVADGKKLSGAEVAFGPVYGLAGFPNGDLLLGCGPKERGRTNSDAVRLPSPGRLP